MPDPTEPSAVVVLSLPKTWAAAPSSLVAHIKSALVDGGVQFRLINEFEHLSDSATLLTREAFVEMAKTYIAGDVGTFSDRHIAEAIWKRLVGGAR